MIKTPTFSDKMVKKSRHWNVTANLKKVLIYHLQVLICTLLVPLNY